MALSKKVVLTCLALLSCAFSWASADSERQAQSESIYPRGVESCRLCHQSIFNAFVQTAHFKTSARAGASSITGEGKGAFSDGRNILRTRTAGVIFKMDRRGADFYQTAIEAANEAAIDASKNRSRTEAFDIV